MFRTLFAAVAAVLAVQVGFSPCTASEKLGGNGSSDGAREALAATSFFGNDSFFSFDSMLQQSMSSLSGILGPLRGISMGADTSLSLSLAKDDPKSCHVNIMMGSALPTNGLKVSLHTGSRHVNVMMHMDETKEEHDPEKGDRRSSSSVHVSSALSLPERCIATPAALLSSLIGYMVVSSSEAQNIRGKIIFPSILLLQDYSEMKLLPGDIIENIQSGDQRKLAELSPQQLCLAAGFTKLECEKLGNKKPEVASVAAVDTPNSVPIPRYDANLELLN